MPTAAALAGPVRICRTSDVDETQQGPSDDAHEKSIDYTARQAVMDIWGQVEFAKSIMMNWPLRDPAEPVSVSNRKLSMDRMRMWLMYAVEYPSRRRRTPVDVEAMVEKWLPIIRGLSTAHDKATVDQCEFDSEEHLLPLTSAPVNQLREFYAKLCDRLEADPTIPFFIWRAFRTWGDVILKKLPDGEVKKLRGDLAKKVANLVEQQIRPDLNDALVGALQWRDPETLTKIAAVVEGGAKPRMRGRESCLFLEVQEPSGVTHTVML
jgi:hypothetical protein